MSGLTTAMIINGVVLAAVLEADVGPHRTVGRLRILRPLLTGQLSVNEIVRRVNISQYTVSKHLKILREAGLVDVERKGRQRLYAVARHLKTHLKTNANVLDLGCCSFQFDKLPK